MRLYIIHAHLQAWDTRAASLLATPLAYLWTMEVKTRPSSQLVIVVVVVLGKEGGREGGVQINNIIFGMVVLLTITMCLSYIM